MVAHRPFDMHWLVASLAEDSWVPASQVQRLRPVSPALSGHRARSLKALSGIRPFRAMLSARNNRPGSGYRDRPD